MLHAALLVFVLTNGDRLWHRALEPGTRSLFLIGGGGGGGGNSSAYINLPSPPKSVAPAMPKVAPPPDKPPPKVETPPVDPEVVAPVSPPVDSVPAATSSATADTAGTGTGSGNDGGTGGGTGGEGTGTGPGSGPGTGPGAGGDGAIRPPELRDLAFPFDNPPKELRGASLSVTFWVRNDGRVDRYEVVPAIADRDYAQKFDEVIRAFRFTPARMPDGTRVAGTTTVTFTLPGKRSS